MAGRTRRNFLGCLVILAGLFIYSLSQPTTSFAQACAVTSPAEINKKLGYQPITISNAYTTSVDQVGSVRGFYTTSASTFNIEEVCKAIQDNGGKSITATCYAGGPIGGFNPDQMYFEVIDVNGSVRCQTQHVPYVNGYTGAGCTIAVNPNPPAGGDPYSVTVSNLPSGIDSQGAEIKKATILGVYQPVPGGKPLVNGNPVTMPPENFNTTVQLAVIATIDGIFYDVDTPICATQFKTGVTPAPDPSAGPGSGIIPADLCKFVSADQKVECAACAAKSGVLTPFGCIETNPQLFIQKILQIAIGLAGGIAFLMILYGSFVTMTSSGNPEKLTEGKEIITSAIAGLLLIVFSAVILRIIGVDILGGFPGLGA
ncbi:MAG: pilin [Patescibacteria group bacterium]